MSIIKGNGMTKANIDRIGLIIDGEPKYWVFGGWIDNSECGFYAHRFDEEGNPVLCGWTMAELTKIAHDY